MMAEAEKKRAMVEKVKELIRSRGGVYDPARGGWEFSNKKFVKDIVIFLQKIWMMLLVFYLSNQL